MYPPAQYVDQRMTFAWGPDQRVMPGAIDRILDWVGDTQGRFILVLGDFGTGKTFLLRELARRLGERKDSAPHPIILEMRNLEKARSIDELVAQHFARPEGLDRIDLKVFRYMLEQGRLVLFFDGFDELAQRVSYDRAGDHFTAMTQALQGQAKIVVSSRT